VAHFKVVCGRDLHAQTDLAAHAAVQHAFDKTPV
jgi:hypothetical protein